MRKLQPFYFFNKAIEILFFEERKISIIINFLTNAKIAFRNIVNTDRILKIISFILITSHTDRNDIRITGMVKQCVGIMDSTIHSVGIYVLKIRFVFGSFIINLTVNIELNEFVFITFVLYQNGIETRSFILKQKFAVRSVPSNAAVF